MALQRTRRKVILPMRPPVLDMSFLKLGATRHRAHRRARRSELRGLGALQQDVGSVETTLESPSSSTVA